MDFRQALGNVCKNHIHDLEYPFVLFSRISDLCKNSYIDKKKARVLYDVSKKIDIVMILYCKKYKEGRDILLSKYYLIENIVSKNNFEKLIEDLSYNLEANIDENLFNTEFE